MRPQGLPTYAFYPCRPCNDLNADDCPTRLFGSEVVPSFVLLDVQESRLTIYVYELLPTADGSGELELKVQELKHSKT